MLLKGKQLADQTITKEKLNLTTSGVLNDNDPTTKQYVDENAKETFAFDQNHATNPTGGTTGDPVMATNSTIQYTPRSGIIVKVNGVEVNVGSNETDDGFFSPDGVIIRDDNEGEIGDYFYWNNTNYELEADDEIDFLYLVNADNPTQQLYTVAPGETYNQVTGIDGIDITFATENPGETATIILNDFEVTIINDAGVFALVDFNNGPEPYTYSASSSNLTFEEGETKQIEISGEIFDITFTGFGSLKASFVRYPFSEEQYIKSNHIIRGRSFGYQLGSSTDRLIVGQSADQAGEFPGYQTSGANKGSITIWERVKGIFQQVAYFRHDDPETDDYFGYAVDIHENYAIVTSSREDGNGTSPSNNSTANSGAAYIFERNSFGVWERKAYLKRETPGENDFWGQDCAIYGDWAAVSTFQNVQIVTLFKRIKGTWTRMQELTGGSNTESGDWFGYKVAMHNGYLAVSARQEDSDGSSPNDNSESQSGAVYLFALKGNTWTQVAYLKSKYPTENEVFGTTLDVYEDTVVVGSANHSRGTEDGDTGEFNSSGAVWIFERNGKSWEQSAFFKAPVVNANDGFGSSISLYNNWLLVGAPFESSDPAEGLDDNSLFGSGAAFLYRRNKKKTWTYHSYYKAGNAAAANVFGSSVSLTGEDIIVSAYGEDSSYWYDPDDTSSSNTGAIYVFNPEPIKPPIGPDSDYSESRILGVPSNFCSIGDDYAVISASYGVTVYNKNNGLWTELGSINLDNFISSIALYNNYFVIGFHNEGQASLYNIDGGEISLVETVTASDSSGSQAGRKIAIVDGFFMMGGPIDDEFGTNAGAVWLFSYDNSSVTEIDKYSSLNAQDSGDFGDEMDGDGDNQRFIVSGNSFSTSTEIWEYNGSSFDRIQIFNDAILSVAIDGRWASYTLRDGTANFAYFYYKESDGTWSFKCSVVAPPSTSSIWGQEISIKGYKFVAIDRQNDYADVYQFKPEYFRWKYIDRIDQEIEEFGTSVSITDEQILITSGTTTLTSPKLYYDTLTLDTIASTSGSISGAFPSEGIIHYWNFDEASGDLIDQVASTDGTLVGGVTQGATGLIGDAYTFNGSTGYVEFEGDSISTSGSMTVSSWINFTANDGMIFSKTDIFTGMWLMINENGYANASYDSESMTGSNSIVGDGWHHVAVTYHRGANNVVSGFLYVDGEAVDYFHENLTPSTPDDNATIGVMKNDIVSTTAFANGSIDEVGVWNRALNVFEINYLYNTGVGQTYSV